MQCILQCTKIYRIFIDIVYNYHSPFATYCEEHSKVRENKILPGQLE